MDNLVFGARRLAKSGIGPIGEAICVACGLVPLLAFVLGLLSVAQIEDYYSVRVLTLVLVGSAGFLLLFFRAVGNVSRWEVNRLRNTILSSDTNSDTVKVREPYFEHQLSRMLYRMLDRFIALVYRFRALVNLGTLVNLDRIHVRRAGFSVIALWPIVEGTMLHRERTQIRAAQIKVRASIYAMFGSLVSLYGLYLYTRSERVRVDSSLIFYVAIIFLSVSFVFLGLHSTLLKELIQLASLTVIRHSEEIASVYGLPDRTSTDRYHALERLTIDLSKGRQIAPSSTFERSQKSLALEDILTHSGVASASGTPAVNVVGATRAKIVSRSPELTKLQISVRTGEQAWLKGHDSNTSARFRFTGGVDSPTSTFRLSIDSPGLEVTPKQIVEDLAVESDVRRWTVSIGGEGAQKATGWYSLYSSGRFIAACQLPEGDE